MNLENSSLQDTWQTLEQKGDIEWEAAYATETIEEGLNLRKSATSHYNAALVTALSQGENLACVRLHRKLGRSYRKSGSVDAARVELSKGLDILSDLSLTVDMRQEREFLNLELVYCDLNEGEIKSVLDRAESIVKACEKDPLRRQPDVWSILGDSYLVIGIVLDMDNTLSSSVSSCDSPEACWGEAEKSYDRVSSSALKERGFLDLTINRARRYQARGRYEEAINDLEHMLPKLTWERALLVWQNLITAYTEKGDIVKAVSIAEESLKHAKRIGDVVGQIRTREMALKAKREQLEECREHGEKSDVLASAEVVYAEGLEFLDFLNLETPEAAAARLELYCVMAEIYLGAGQISRAKEKAQVAKREAIGYGRLISLDENFGVEVMLALIDWQEGNFDDALQKLEGARGYFKEGGKLRQVIRIDIVRAEILISKNATEEARSVLERAREIALGQHRQRDLSRIETLLRELPDRRRKSLGDRRVALLEEYQAANDQLLSTIDAADRVRIQRRIDNLEQDIQKVESELTALG